MSQPIIAEALARAVANHRGRPLAPAVRETYERLLVDIAGLCVAARNASYVHAALESWEAAGGSTAIGHARTLDAAGAAFVNGTAAHGEDFDDTFEGGPVHSGVVAIPALLAAAERHRIAGPDMLYGMAVAAEVMCRGSLVAPKKIHKAGFHPTAVLGAMGAAAGVAAAMRLDEKTFASAQGIAGSMASGIIEYLAEGTSTKRMHPGWAAQAGMRAVDLARAGFDGPRTVWEGTHGFLHGFANTPDGAWERLTADFGERWVSQTIAFKPYACGTMIHPYIDCARRLSLHPGSPLGQGLNIGGPGRGIDNIASITCDTAEGIVHRLWEPLAVKQRPPNAYSAKFSVPFCVAYGLTRGAVGLEAFTEENAHDPQLLAIAAKVGYVIDPNNPYPDEYTGHVRVTMTDGTVLEERQPYLRGGHREPLTRADIEDKFRANCAYGGWPKERAERWLAMARTAFDSGIDLKEFRG